VVDRKSPQKPIQRRTPYLQHPRVVGVRLPDRVYEELKATAADKGLTLAEVIRQRLARSSTAPTAA
jgi:predicted DNA binding CopG/RHH family protein